ncbi:hypothetical protein TPAR_06775, partial [Tolypocladium paradoxum]
MSAPSSYSTSSTSFASIGAGGGGSILLRTSSPFASPRFIGIPSPSILMQSPGLRILPRGRSIEMPLPSRCFSTTREKPVKDSASLSRQIISESRKDVVGFLRQGEDNISGYLIGVLIGLALQHDPFPLHGSSRDVNLQCLLLLHGPLSLALLAAILLLEEVAGALAVVAHNRLAPHHARANLSDCLDHADALAALAQRRLRLFLPARTLTLAAEDLLVGGKLDRLALVELLERHLVLLLLVGSSSWASRYTGAAGPAGPAHVEAKHLRENVVEVDLGAAGTTSRAVKGGHAVGVIEVPLLVIAEDL